MALEFTYDLDLRRSSGRSGARVYSIRGERMQMSSPEMEEQMKSSVLVLAVVCGAIMISCSPRIPVAPTAEKMPHELELHGDVRVDDYYWLRERTNPEVLEYLEAENAYTLSMMAETEPFQEELFEELKNRIKPNDSTVPALFHGYYYYKRYEGSLEYPIYCRKQGSVEATEEIILDVNQIAEGHDFCSVRGAAVSPDSRLLAWARIYPARK